MKLKVYQWATTISCFVMLIATLGVKPACTLILYQPKVPKCLGE